MQIAPHLAAIAFKKALEIDAELRRPRWIISVRIIYGIEPCWRLLR